MKKVFISLDFEAINFNKLNGSINILNQKLGPEIE